MAKAVPHEPILDEEVKMIPPYNVVLLNDDDHSYYYTVEMLMRLFGHSLEMAYGMAKEVDKTGRVIVFTGPFEKAEFKKDQIQAYGADPSIERCKGSMTAVVEPAL